MKSIDVKSLSWGHDGDKMCFYAKGHIDPSVFASAAIAEIRNEYGDCADAPAASDIEHIWFRSMSPSEARARGFDSGFMQAQAPAKPRRGVWPVTAVKI